MRRLALTILLAIVPIATAAAALSPSALIAGASSYDGKSVTVTGKVSNFQTSSTMMGTVAGFQLCDSKCIVVIDQTDHARSNGSAATVTGTFHVTFKGPRKTFNNAVVIGR
jgi:glycine/serine hydroxymethyltransferase